MLQTFEKLLPRSVRHYRAERRQKAEFTKLGRIACDSDALAPTQGMDPATVMSNRDIAEEWERTCAEIAEFKITDEAGGVNAGDRRALYYLIRYLRPRSVLEVGTHIGASTVHIAAALRNDRGANDFDLTTVDILDVNDPKQHVWSTCGSTYSPAEMIRRLGCQQSVTFVAQDSIEFLRRSQRTYDFVFLDGRHAPGQVYQEVPAALRLLEPGSYILLHDYFPNAQPLWSGRPVVPGPHQAIRRLQDEGAALDVVPLGGLPWPTKLGSNVTSLAVLCRRAPVPASERF